MQSNDSDTRHGGDVGIQLPAFCIIAYSNENLEIQRIHAHHHGTDVVMVGYRGLTERSAPTPTLIEDVVSEYNARQGFSWVGGIGMAVRRSKFMSSGKVRFSSPPGAGIDIEAEESVIRDGVFENVEIANNSGVGFVADSGDSAHITVRNSSIWGNTGWSIWPLKPYMRFEGCDIHGAGVNLYGSRDNPAAAVKFVGCSFDDVDHPQFGKAYGDMLLNLGGGISQNVEFEGCPIHGHQRQEPVHRRRHARRSDRPQQGHHHFAPLRALVRGLRIRAQRREARRRAFHGSPTRKGCPAT